MTLCPARFVMLHITETITACKVDHNVAVLACCLPGCCPPSRSTLFCLSAASIHVVDSKAYRLQQTAAYHIALDHLSQYPVKGHGSRSRPRHACRQHTLRIPTGDIQDPVKRDLEKSMRERQLLCPTRLRTPPVAGKQTLSTIMWDKLDSTPIGHHMDHDGNYITKALTPEELLVRKSDVVFDDYNVVTGGRCVMSA